MDAIGVGWGALAMRDSLNHDSNKIPTKRLQRIVVIDKEPFTQLHDE